MDQVAALHWINENIHEFGGDPNNVSILGHGHGAVCVNLLMLSPMARGESMLQVISVKVLVTLLWLPRKSD